MLGKHSKKDTPYTILTTPWFSFSHFGSPFSSALQSILFTCNSFFFLQLCSCPLLNYFSSLFCSFLLYPSPFLPVCLSKSLSYFLPLRSHFPALSSTGSTFLTCQLFRFLLNSGPSSVWVPSHGLFSCRLFTSLTLPAGSYPSCHPAQE